MFVIHDHAITPRKAAIDRAIKRLPEAHSHALHAGISHLHSRLVERADEAGLDSTSLVIGWHKKMPFLGIADSDHGDDLFNMEFGLPDQAPNPVLRTSIREFHPAANAVYNETLRRELWS